MRLTTSQLRELTRDQAGFLAAMRRPPPEGGNPQRIWLDAAWRQYFAEGRDPRMLVPAFEAAVRRNGLTDWKRSMSRPLVPVLNLFANWDATEPGPHATFFSHRPPDAVWRGHTLALRRDLFYVAGDHYMVRLLWNDRHSIRERGTTLSVTAVLAASDSDLGDGAVEAIEVWQLRNAQRRRFQREELVRGYGRLEALLSQTEERIQALAAE